MIKRATYLPSDTPGGGFNIVEPGNSGSMEKVASLFSPEIVQFLENLSPDPNLVYALVNALGAGEYFSSNKNGDYFPEEALKKYHPTFVSNAHVFQHHRNKNPRKRLGDVLHSNWNDNMKRVELIITLDRRREPAKKVITKLENGNYVMTSMGARVPYDQCSICGTKAKTRAQYCDHLNTSMHKVLPDGRKVFAINDKPNFFDISIVLIPADKTSGIMLPFLEKNAQLGDFKPSPVMQKVASAEPVLEKVASVENSDSEKTSAMVKRTPGDLKTSIEQDRESEVYDTTEAIPDETLKQMGESAPLNESLSTMMALRVMPKPEEFQKLVLASAGRWDDREKIASISAPSKDEVETAPGIDNLGPDFVSEKVARLLGPHLDKVSLTMPAVTKRLLEKNASTNVFPNPSQERSRALWKQLLLSEEEQPQLSPVKNPALPMAAMGALYAGYVKMFNDTNPSKFRSFLKSRPWLLGPALAGSIGLGSAMAQKSSFGDVTAFPVQDQNIEKTGSLERLGGSFLLSTPLSYYKAGEAEANARQGIPISSLENFIRQHPFITSLIGTGAGYGLSKKIPGIAKNVQKKLDITL